MHVIEHYFDVCGFDHRLVRGGTSVYLWNLSRSLAARGHRVSVVSPAHGQLEYLRRHHDVRTLSYQDDYELAIPLDARVWPDFPDRLTWPSRTTAHLLTLDGVDLYLLSNDLLNRLPETFYPPYDAKGRDPVFFKPLAFQVDSIRFIRTWFAGERAIVHAHEPYYHYLVPVAFKDDPDKLVVSTVQSNMPITKMVYRREVEELLDLLGVPAAPDPPAPAGMPPPAPGALDPLGMVMSQYQRLTHLHYEYPRDYVAVFGLVAEHAKLIDFLSPGQVDFYSTFADTPFERLFARLEISATVARNAHKFFVGGCAIADRWIDADPTAVDRVEVLRGLGLDPALPTFFHNARYAVHHKGQVELMRAADRVLGEGLEVNFVIRCLSGSGIDDPYFHDVARRHRGRLYLEWSHVPEERVLAYAASADYCLFPSKFEMDTFLIAQGEAMACGAVPIATAQRGMAHFGHVADPLREPGRDTATGFAVNRSFAEDDRLLVDALVDRVRRAARLLTERPAEYRRLSANAVATARRFTWTRCVESHLAAFQPLVDGVAAARSDEIALRRGWFHRLSPSAWRERADEIAERALALGDVDAYHRVATPSREAARRLYDAAYLRADFDACEAVAALAPPGTALPGLADLRLRCVVEPARDASGWRVTYRLPHADRVELVRASRASRTPSSAAAGDGSARALPEVIELRPADGDGARPPAPRLFTAVLPEAPPPTGLHFLITLSSGRTVWDSHHG